MEVSLGNASILVVDDNKTMRDTLQEFMETEGYSVVSCEDGPAALKLAGEKHFEIVLTDFQMPEMNGAEVVKLLRQQYPETFIIGFSLANKKQVFLEAGANQFISKEQLLSDLIPTIENRN
jgi:CheY-like chemotaxis protein